MRTTLYAVAGLLGVAVLAAGCGRSSDGEENAAGKKPAEKEQVKIDPIAGKLGVFDEGRIEVPLPKGWRESANEENTEKDIDKNLARMASGAQRLPGILIKVRDYGDFKTLGEPDLRRFVRARNNELVKERGAGFKVKVKPLSLGDFHGAEYAYRAKIGSSTFERLTAETVVDSRLYTFELTTVVGLREEARPALYAVVTGMKFPKMVNKPTAGRRSADEEGADEEGADEEGADEEGADEESGDEDAAAAKDEATTDENKDGADK